MLLFAGLLLSVGLSLFSGDLLFRDFFGTRLFPMAAPAGGLALIAGWLMIALDAAISPFRKDAVR